MTTPDDVPSSAQRLFATAFYAPIGFGARLVEDLPRGLGKARQTVSNARVVGKMAIKYGTRELKQRLESASVDGEVIRPADIDAAESCDDSGVSETLRSAGNGDAPEPIVDATNDAVLAELDVDAAVDVDAATGFDEVVVGELALPDYDHLPAAHIIGKLHGLTVPERQSIGAYEAAHRGRRTVLGKLAQLDAS